MPQQCFIIDWHRVRRDFIEYVESKQFNHDYRKSMLRYLDKYVSVIGSPMDMVKVFARIKKGRRNLWLGLRNIITFYQDAQGYPKDFLDSLRKAMPQCDCGIDLKVPNEDNILESLRKLKGIPREYVALYNLLLDSGLRLVEAVKAINEFNGAEKINGFYRINIGEFRGSKQAYYCYFTEATYKMIQQCQSATIKAPNASAYFDKNGFISPKYIRKFVFDKMIELEIPESVADFIEGRVATKIGAKHYMALARQANGFYGKYAEYINRLKAKAGQVLS